MKNFKSGNSINQGTFSCFIPNEINRNWLLDDLEVIELMSQADRELGRLDMYSEHTPNIDLFISMHVLKEATQSSKIEGTQTNIEQALHEKENLNEEQRDDWEEVQNYIQALNSAVASLDNLPLSTRLIKQAHKMLLTGVRGKHKIPGQFRTSQNWIGGASISDATFVPPPQQEVARLMGDLEKFCHNAEIRIPHVLKIGLIHYQFETIHPFLDGNGRVGRLLITLYLVEKGILKKPLLYLSDFFESHRNLYYENLMKVRTNNDLKQWLKFFLVGVIETAKASIHTFDNIMKLQKEVELKLQTLGARASKAQKVVNQLYIKPMINVQKIADVAEVSLPSAYKLTGDLETLGILTEITGDQRSKLYRFDEYIQLFK